MNATTTKLHKTTQPSAPPSPPTFDEDRAAPTRQAIPARRFGKLSDEQVALLLEHIASSADTHAQIALFAREEAGQDRVGSYCASLAQALLLMGAMADLALNGEVRSSNPIEWLLPTFNKSEGL